MAYIYKLIEIATGNQMLPVTVFDAVKTNDGSKTLSEVLNSIQPADSTMVKVAESGFYITDSLGNIAFKVDQNGIDASIISDSFSSKIISKLRTSYLDAKLDEIALQGYGDGENIGDLQPSTNIDGLFVEVFDSATSTNRKINLKDYINTIKP